ncbi:MAG TPA: DUF3971 domain-containing protein [Acidocella sp.]|nr:DUF3971 domain-containing protein [Acidocella sp.]
MKRHAGQAGRFVGEALHQVGRIAMFGLVLVLLSVCLLGYRLSKGPLDIPYLASRLATAASGQGISVRMQKAELAWAGYRQGGGVPLFLQLGNISIRNAIGVELVDIPSARLVFKPAALLGGRAPILISGQQARFAGSAVPVSLAAALHLNSRLGLSSASIEVLLGAGRIGAGQDSAPIIRGGFSLYLTPNSAALTNGWLALAPQGHSAPHIGFSARAVRDGQWVGKLHLTADAVQAADLHAYWPPDAAPHARAWVTKNITAGTARDAVFDVTLDAPRSLAQVQLEDVTGRFDGQDLTLSWLPRARPLTGLNGTMVFENRDLAVITARSATLGALTVTGGQMTITGLDHPDQTGDVNVALAGTVPAVFSLLDAPPINLGHDIPPNVAAATGAVKATVTASIPFTQRVQLEDVNLRVAASLADVALATPLQGVGLSHGAGTLQATADALKLMARAQLGGEPADVRLDISFAHGGTLRGLTVASRAGPETLHRLGLAEPSALPVTVTGVAPYTIRLMGRLTGSQSAVLDADLTPLALALPKFDWRKTAGATAQLELTATLNHEALTALNSLTATGPGLDIKGDTDGGSLVFSRLDIGRTRAHGTISPPDAAGRPWKIVLAGPELDLRPNTQSAPHSAAMPRAAAQQAVNKPGAAPRWQVSLNFQKLDLARSPAPDFSGLRFFAAGQGGTVLQARGTATGVALTIAPSGPAARALTLQAQDAGFLLRAMDAFEGMEGGKLALDAHFDDAPGTPAVGTLTLKDFRLRQAPAFTKVMQGLTLYGVGAAASGPGLGFSQAVVPFTLTGQELQLHDARAYSASLGFTASGRIGLDDGGVDMDATIVPAYALNTLPGKIPLLGHLFTAEHGGGLFAMRAKLTGKLADPKVTVNPLSALTPGFLRGLFGIGKGQPPKAAPQPAPAK